MTNTTRVLTVTAILAALFATPAAAEGPHVAPVKEFAQAQVAKWIRNPSIVDAVKAQNSKHAGLTPAEVEGLDQQWRSQTGAASQPMIEQVLNSALSQHLSGLKADQQGLVTEIFVMDNKGLNVGQSDVTSDYWQGDEAKWQKTYLAGPDAVFVDEVEQDESTQVFQSQISMAITDPTSGEVIGAITVGVNVDDLL